MKRIWNRLINSIRKVNTAVWVVIILLVAARIFLPVAAKYGINWYLGNKLATYKGHIDDFDLALYRGAYQIKDLKIWKRTSSEDKAFAAIKKIDLSLAWRAIFKGKLLGDLEIDGARLNLVDSDDKKKKQLGADEDWKTMIGKLVPIDIESLAMLNSEVHWINRDLKIPIDVVLDRIDIKATNIKNTNDKKELLPSSVVATARFQKSAPVVGSARMNLISRIPAFEANLKMEKLDITKLNDFFLAYGPFTFTSGTFSVYAEVGTRDNRIKGYVKPFFENLDVIDPKEKFDSPKRFFNEVGLAMANLILRNAKTKTVATKIEFEGVSHGPDIEKWDAFVASLKNGFVAALSKSIDHSISIKDVPTKK